MLSGHGLVPRGGFYPAVEDDVPGLPTTLVMVGNVGATMWESFERFPSDVSDPLDQWSKNVLDAVAGEVSNGALSLRRTALLARFSVERGGTDVAVAAGF